MLHLRHYFRKRIAQAISFFGKPVAGQPALRLTAVVPANATAGPVSVRTGAGPSSSATAALQPTVLANADAQETARLLAWPNPVSAAAATATRSSLYHSYYTSRAAQCIGQVTRTMPFSGRITCLSLRGLAPEVYQLALFLAGQPAQWRRIVVTE